MSRIKISRVVANVLDNSFLTVLSNNIVATLLTTSNVAEGANLYFSNTRARAAVGSANQSTLIYYEANGNFQVNVETIGSVTSVNGQSGTVTLTTANIAEGANLYFTNARAQLAAIPAVNQIVVTTPVFNYNFDQYVGDNPSIYVTAGETISFELIQGASHPFAIRVSNGGSNYNTGLTHVDTDGTVTTGSGAQGKYTGKLFWKIPYELAGNTYVYQCTNHSSMVGNIVIQPPQILLTTNNIAEGSNLYFTNNRVWANVGANIGNLNAWTSSNSSNIGNLNSWVATHNTTTGIVEGTNLYFTNARARAAVGAVGSNLVYYEANGNFQVIVSTGGGAVDSVNGQTGTVVLTTSNIAEGSNLYYTDNRVWANVGANIGNLNAWTDSNSSNIGNLNSWIRTLSTTGIAEGANLYFTNARVYSALYNSSANTTPIAAQSIFLQDGAANGIIFDSPNAADYANISVQTNAGATYLTFYVGDNTADLFKFYAPSSNNGLQFNDQVVWHAGNDGAGSGLDADLLDNNNSSYYTLTTNHTEGTNLFFTNTRVRAAVGAVGSNLTYYEANGNYQVTVPGSNQQVIFNNNGQLGASSGLYYDGVSLKVNGNMESLYSSGSEGGEIFLNKAATGTTINNGVTIDVNGDRLRFFEAGGTNRGFYIDITTGGSAAGTNLVGGGGGSVTSVGSYTGAVSNAQLLGAVQSGGTSISFDQIHSSNNSYGTNFKVGDDAWIGDFNVANAIKIKGQQDAANGFISFGSNSFTLGVAGTGELTYGGNKVYHAGNDGDGSGLDADLLDNNNSSYYTLTTNHTEGTNLFFTNARARAAITTAAANAKGISYVESTGEFSLADSGVTAGTYGNATLIPSVTVDRYGRITNISNVVNGGSGGGTVSSINGQTGAVVLTTTDIAEGSNLYYTDNRVWSNVGANIGNINSWLTTTNSNIGNLNSWVATHNTTTGIVEGTNLYFTNARARAAITTAAANAKGLSYVESTGEFSLADSGATAAIYGGASQIPAVVVDRYGRITAASNVALSGSGTVTGFNFTGGIVTVTNPNTVPSLTVAGTSGGVVYFSSSSTWASSGALAASAIVIGGGAGNAPSTTTTGTGVLTAIGNAVNTNGGLVTQSGTLTSSTLLIGGGSGSGISTTTTGTGVLTALGVSVGSSGAFVVNGGALGTPTSGTVTNLTGTASININGTVGATTPAAGQFTSLVASGLFTSNTTAEVVTALSGATGTVTHDTALSSIFYHTSPAANFTANFTNVPTTDNRAISVTLVIAQGATPYICNAVQINGVGQTIRWQGGSAPTGTGSRWEAINFTLLDVGATWIVMGALFSHG